MNKKIPLKILDIPAITLAIALTVFLAYSVYSPSGASSQVKVKGQEKTWIFPINSSETISVSGPLGQTVVAINKGTAAIVSSPCAGQTCVAAGELGKNGQWAACLPNMVFLLIEGTSTDEIDAVAW